MASCNISPATLDALLLVHDLNDQLTAIRGYAQLIDFQVTGNHERLEEIIRAADRASEIVKRLLVDTH